MSEAVIRFEKIFFEIELNSPVEKVYQALTTQMNQWWPHKQNKDSRDIIFEARVGGRFYESWGNEQGLFYAMITELRENKTIKMTGPMGMRVPIVGNIEFELSGANGTTLLKVCHQLAGPASDSLISKYKSGWKEVLEDALPSFLASR